MSSKFVQLVWLLVALLMYTGCGHNMLVESEAIGFVFRIPAGEANYMGIAIGSTKSVVACVRGGASFESTTSAGGGVLSASGAENKITAFRSNLQFNEGNLRDAFTNPDIPMEVKLRLADGVVEGSKAPKFPDAIVTTRDAVMQVGSEAVGSNATSVASLKATGIDNLVNNTPAIIDSATAPVTETVHNLVNPLEGTVSSVTGVVNSVNETITGTIEEFNNTIDRVDNVANNTLNQAQKTLLYVIGGLAVAICLVIIFLTLHSIFKKPDPRDKKIHIGHHVDDEPASPSDPKEPDATEDEESPEVVLDEDDDAPDPPRPRKPESSDEPPGNKWKKFKDKLVTKLAPLLGILGAIPNQVAQRLAKMVLGARKPKK